VDLQGFLKKEKPRMVKKKLEGILAKYKILHNLTI
jgi:hypothetical protein